MTPAAHDRDAAALATPALVVDLDAMERNLARMAAYARERGLALRPHAKMHKCSAIALQQLRAGAVGVCAQTLAEAQALVAGGVGDVFISNEIVDEAKLTRVAQLAGRAKLALAVDSALGTERLAAALRSAGGPPLDVFVEIDVGQGRCGIEPARAATLAARVQSHGLRFAGLHAYHGRAQHLRSAAERRAAIDAACAQVRVALDALRAAGIASPLVTGAGSGSFAFEATSGLYGELQPGSYLFMDRDYADNEAAPGAPRFEHALYVKCQVVSRRPGQAVIDAGLKAHAQDSGPPALPGLPGVSFQSGGDEHGLLRGPDAGLPALGATVWLVPGHCDPTVALHGRYALLRGGLHEGRLEGFWPIDARG